MPPQLNRNLVSSHLEFPRQRSHCFLPWVHSSIPGPDGMNVPSGYCCVPQAPFPLWFALQTSQTEIIGGVLVPQPQLPPLFSSLQGEGLVHLLATVKIGDKNTEVEAKTVFYPTDVCRSSSPQWFVSIPLWCLDLKVKGHIVVSNGTWSERQVPLLIFCCQTSSNN